jgi:hypothetical protein
VTKIAITSVGSLVGQNILDSLEGRRAGIEVVGINSAADAAGIFRCDRAYLAPPAADAEQFRARLASILLEERPHLVLPGRDADVLALARLKEELALLRPALPVGPQQLALALEDKWASCLFAAEHGLPYVDSAPADDRAAVDRLLSSHGYPLIAKPRAGNGSRGVRIVFDEAQCSAIARQPGYLLQAYLEPEADLPSWKDLAKEGTPLFHAPRLRQIACQAVIGPDGSVRGLTCTVVELVMGRLESAVRLDDPAVTDVARRWVEALAAEGWMGALNLQGRRDAGGTFRIYELNGRFTGGTNARTHLGFDEVGILIGAFAGHALPPHRSVDRLGFVTKSLSDFPVLSADIEQLRSKGHWQHVETRR